METLSPKDLRIGNLFMDAKNRLCEVEEITKEDIRILAKHGAITSHPVIPIPLTAELLERMGFENNDDNDFYRKDVLSYGKISVNWLGWEVAVELSQVRGFTLGYVKIKYVHQLQNLFFALCGEELTIKEPIKSK